MSSLNFCVIFGFLRAITKKIAATEDCKIDSTIDWVSTLRLICKMESSNLTLCVVNAFLSSIASILNILTIYAIRKTPSLAKNLKILLLSLAVSHLGISLLAQPMYVAQLTMQWKYRNESYNAIYIAHLIPKNIFINVSLFSVMALYAERFLAIQLHHRYQELVMYRRVIIAVISIWVFSTLSGHLLHCSSYGSPKISCSYFLLLKILLLL